jgi:hypothetical protein
MTGLNMAQTWPTNGQFGLSAHTLHVFEPSPKSNFVSCGDASYLVIRPKLSGMIFSFAFNLRVSLAVKRYIPEIFFDVVFRFVGIGHAFHDPKAVPALL